MRTGAEEKTDCSSIGFFQQSLSQTNLITIFVCMSSLPVSFFFYLFSLTVNKTVQQEKLLKMKTNIIRMFFKRFQCGLVLVSGTKPM